MTFEQVVEFHGHSCPGLAIGYRAAMLAQEYFAAMRDCDEELIAVVYTDACGVDAVQAVLGCTLGKGNLFIKDWGKQVYLIAERRTGKVLRLALKAEYGRSDNPDRDTRLQNILNATAQQLFAISSPVMELPQRARIFNNLVCTACGEMVMEARARVQNGQIVCLECATEYSRGW